MSDTKQILTKAGLQDSHWGKIILEAENRGNFTEDDADKAQEWVTCACGKVNSDIERHIDGIPVDITLGDLGEDFAKIVGMNMVEYRYKRAANTLVEIEQRALVVSSTKSHDFDNCDYCSG